MKWNIEESKAVNKILNRVPDQVVRKYQFWLEMMQNYGPHAVKSWKGFKDEKLKGRWRRFRAFRLNKQYRVIYRVEHESVTVFVMKIDPHTYR